MGWGMLTTRENDTVFKWIFENARTAEIDDFHDTVFVHNDVIKLQITVCQSHTVQVCHAAENLQERAGDLL